MNSKIANLLADNLKNKQIIAEMIMHICSESEVTEHRLIGLCLSTDAELVTKDIVLKHIDKIKPLCMKYMSNIIDVDNIKVDYIDNITCSAHIQFKATVEAWFKDKTSADRGASWYASDKEDNEHKIKGTYITECSTYIDFKDIDLD